MSIFFVQINPTNGVYEERSEYDRSEFLDFVKELFEDVTTATDYRYNACDDQGYRLDTIKIIENPNGSYLGIYHFDPGGIFQVRLANSTDLLHWTFLRTIEQNASQPTIAQVPNDAYIIVFEKREDVGNHHLKVHYYSNLSTLINGPLNFTIDIPRTLSNSHEGTPNVYNITVKDCVMNACIGFHYYNGSVDNVAIGWLTVDLRDPSNPTWCTQPQTEYNRKLREDWNVKGNIGDRDYGQIFGRNFTLQEGCLVQPNGHWAYYRIFLYDHLTNNFTMLNVRTHYNATSFGNPTFTVLASPNGKLCVVVTYFLFYEGLPDEYKDKAGELIFYKEFDSYEKTIHYENNDYPLLIFSNSTVTNINLNETDKSISFNVSGPGGSKGYCIIELQNNLTRDLWQDNYTVLFDGEPWPSENWTTIEFTYIYLDYLHSEHEIKIVPEFSNVLLLMMLVGSATVFVLYIKGEWRRTRNAQHL
jgi:hypothetical protein